MGSILGGGGSPPPSINPYEVSMQQQTASQNAANSASYLNNVNQVTPYGSLTYDVTGGTYDYGGNWVPQWTATQSLSPDQQKLHDSQMGVTQGAYNLANQYVDRIGAATSQPFSTAGAPASPNVPTYNATGGGALPTYNSGAVGHLNAPSSVNPLAAPGPVDQYSDAYRNDVYGKMLDRASGAQAADRMALETRLANQGISIGSEAYQKAMGDYNRGINDFRIGADISSGQNAAQQYQSYLAGNQQQWGQGLDKYQADLMGNQQSWSQGLDRFQANLAAQGQAFDKNAMSYSLGNQQALQNFNVGSSLYTMGQDARKNYITEQQMLRMQPIQETAALLGTGGGQQYPSFVPTNNYQVQPADVGGIFGMAAAQDSANYQAQQQSQNAAMGGLFGLAGSLGGGYLYGLGKK